MNTQNSETQSNQVNKEIETIERIAEQLYRNRVSRDQDGDARSDWQKAEKISKNPISRFAFEQAKTWHSLIKAIELHWITSAFTGFYTDLKRTKIIDFLELFTTLYLIYTASHYFVTSQERQKQTHYQAWGVINSAVGNEAGGGRKSAIEDLWNDEVSLAGLDISGAHISDLDLSVHCRLIGFKIASHACERGIPLTVKKKANLQEANFSNSKLEGINLELANLENANFEKAILKRANLAGSYLNSVKASYADLSDSNLSNTYLAGANFESANLKNADLSNAYLAQANFDKANFHGANLSNAHFEEDSLKKAIFCNTELPDTITIQSDRDCDSINP